MKPVTYDIITHDSNELASHHVRKKKLEPVELLHLNKYLKEGDHVLDIGGNIGCHAINFGNQIAPTGKLVSFEPMKANYEILKQNIEKYKFENNMLALNVALGFKNTKKDFIVNTANMGDCRGYTFPDYPHEKNYDTEEITQITLDTFFEQHNTLGIEWDKISLIKMDTQASEIGILKGAVNCFKEKFKGNIYMEFYPIGLHNNNEDIEWFYNFMEEQNFNKIYIFDKEFNNAPIKLATLSDVKNFYNRSIKLQTHWNLYFGNNLS